MVTVLLSGCNGKMGQVISREIAIRKDCEIVAGIDVNTDQLFSYPVFSNFEKFEGKADVIIDFSNPTAVKGLLSYAKATKTPAVIATTGITENRVSDIHKAAKEIPIFFTANMSIGINLLSELAQIAAKLLQHDFDIEIVEAHHNQKIDAPSGTALLLADSMSEVLDEKPYYEYDRHALRDKRMENEIGIHSIRGGTIIGEHEIVFAGHDEVIRLTHSAMSKDIFAIGALNAGVFLAHQEAGLYDMKNLIQAQSKYN